MTEKEIHDKVGALHLRLMDDEPNYLEILGHMTYYQKENEHYTEDVLTALTDGLNNYEQYLELENALSPRCIRIIKREQPKGGKLSAVDTEGAYQVVLHFNDDTETVVHFSRKSEQLLYMLMVMTSIHNGYVSDFLNKPTKDDFVNLCGPDDEEEEKEDFDEEDFNDDEIDDQGIDLDDIDLDNIYTGPTLHSYEQYLEQYNHNIKVIEDLAKMVYPKNYVKGLLRDLDPKSNFTDIQQKMRSSLNASLKGKEEEKQWFFPFIIRYGRDVAYQLHLSPANIIIPKEMMELVNQLPDAKDYVDITKGHTLPCTDYINGLTELAMDGDTDAINRLGNSYIHGWDVVADKSKAFQWFRKSAEAGDAEGLFWMGVFYSTGDCVSQNYKKAIEYWEKASAEEHDDAIFQLGKLYMHGFGCEKNWKKALAYFKKATELGNADAANEAGYLLTNGGFGLRKNEAKAFDFFLDAANMDHPEATRYVIRAYREGTVEEEDNDLEYWIDRSISLDIPENNLQIGMMMYEDEAYEEAFNYLYMAENEGLTCACPLLAKMLIKGMGVKTNPDKAHDILEKGVINGDTESIDLFKKLYPEDWKLLETKLKAVINHRQHLLEQIDAMTPQGNQELFLDIIDAYREKFLGLDYIREINKQLSIHRPSTDNSGNGGKRRIVVRRSSSNKVGYEIVIILANGEEVVVNSINYNSLIIYLLAIICSYKSGYTSDMAKSDACKPIIAQLYKMVVPNTSDSETRYFIDIFLDPGQKNNYYKTYSYRAAQAIKKAVDTKDNPSHYLFNNVILKNRSILRCMKTDIADIDLPQELVMLAQKMPDAKSILKLAETQELTE